MRFRPRKRRSLSSESLIPPTSRSALRWICAYVVLKSYPFIYFDIMQYLEYMESKEKNDARKWFLVSVSSYFILRSFIPNPDVRNFIACQFALESDFGGSALARVRHNFCGMKLPKSRLFYGEESYDSFAEFSNLNDCIIDYVSWVLYNRPSRVAISSVDAYASWLESKGYCPEKDYVDKIRSIYNQYYC